MEVGETIEGGSIISCLFSIAQLISRSDRYMRSARVRPDLVGLHLDRVAVRQRNGQLLIVVVDQHPFNPSIDQLTLLGNVRIEGFARAGRAVVRRRDPNMLGAVVASDSEDTFA